MALYFTATPFSGNFSGELRYRSSRKLPPVLRSYTRMPSSRRKATSACWRPDELTVTVDDTPLWRHMRTVIRADELARRITRPRKVGSGSEERDFQLRRAEETHRGWSTDHGTGVQSRAEANIAWNSSESFLGGRAWNDNDTTLIANYASAELLTCDTHYAIA